MTTTFNESSLASDELAVAAALDVIAEETKADVHRLTIQALLMAAGEQAALADEELPDREALSQALLSLRAHHYATLQEGGFRLTEAGQKIAVNQVSKSFREELVILLRRRMKEWLEVPARA